MAGLYSRSHTNAAKAATSPRACAPSLDAVLGTHLLVIIDFGRPGLEKALAIVWSCWDGSDRKQKYGDGLIARSGWKWYWTDEDKRACWSARAAPLNLCHSFNDHKLGPSILVRGGLWFPPGPRAVRHRRVFIPTRPFSATLAPFTHSWPPRK